MTTPFFRTDKVETRYAVIIPRTRMVLETVSPASEAQEAARRALDRAKKLALWHWRRLQHPVYPPEVVVERIGPDGKRRRVWSAQVTA